MLEVFLYSNFIIEDIMNILLKKIILWVFAICFVSCNKHMMPNKIEQQIKPNLVANWQIENFTYAHDGSPGYLHDYGLDAWTNAVLFMGMFEWANATNNETYFDWLNDIGDKNKWKVPANFMSYPAYTIFHADELCMSQFYLQMYSKYEQKYMLDATIQRIDEIMNVGPNNSMSARSKQKWTWCDALYMAPNVYIQLYNITGNDKYLEFMHNEFMDTYNHLYDKNHKLFFRDDSFFDKREKNGQKIFWGRGNGWVVAGLANMLKNLPLDYENRAFYEDLLNEMLVALVKIQNNKGFWHASLLDPQSYPAPESSATALITYAMAYAINNDIINKTKYLPTLNKTWNALQTVITNDGKMGYVQPIGADPRTVTSDMTAVYGVGAYLLAASEIYKLIN